MGRNDDEDITISDPSVSGRHASIDIVELPGAGGKRVTLKVAAVHLLRIAPACFEILRF